MTIYSVESSGQDFQLVEEPPDRGTCKGAHLPTEVDIGHVSEPAFASTARVATTEPLAPDGESDELPPGMMVAGFMALCLLAITGTALLIWPMVLLP
jgi:hypothetical protein